MEPEEFDIESLRDTRNLKAKGISNKSNNIKDVARRTRQSEKRAKQAQINKKQQIEPQPEYEQLTKYSNGKAKREKPKDQGFEDQPKKCKETCEGNDTFYDKIQTYIRNNK